MAGAGVKLIVSSKQEVVLNLFSNVLIHVTCKNEYSNNNSSLFLVKPELPVYVKDVRQETSDISAHRFLPIPVLTQLWRSQTESYLVNGSMQAPVIYSSRLWRCLMAC